MSVREAVLAYQEQARITTLVGQLAEVNPLVLPVYDDSRQRLADANANIHRERQAERDRLTRAAADRDRMDSAAADLLGLLS